MSLLRSTSLLVQKLADCLYKGDLNRVPTTGYLSPQAPPLPENFVASLGVERTVDEKKVVYSVGSTVPHVATWLETLGGPTQNWLRALLTSESTTIA